MNYNTLKTSVAAVIKENGNNEITGDILQQTLIAMINSLGVGYQFMGVAQPSTNPGAPDQRVFYIAAEPGTYTGFNAEVVPGEIAIFKFSNTWLKDSIFAIDLANVGFKGVFESGIGLDPSDGEPIVDVNYDASDYIPVGPGCVIVYSGGETDSNRAAIIGYDEDKYMVSVLLAGGSDWKNKIVAITDPDIKYVRVSSCNQNHENYNTPFAFNVVATTDVLVKVQELIEDVELLSERIQQIDPVINVIRNGYTFKGIALPNETLTEDVVSTFYWIETAGTYPGGTLAANEVGLLIWNGADWTIEKLNLAKATALETTNIALTALAGIVTDILSVVAAGYEYMGVVTPNSVFPADTYKYKVAFLAQTPGTYTNHGAFAIGENEIALLMYDPASEEWSKQTLDVAKLSYSEETYAKQNGEYPEMKVGQATTAENVSSAKEDSPMFTFRKTPVAANVLRIEEIKGNSIAWNQLLQATTVEYFTKVDDSHMTYSFANAGSFYRTLASTTTISGHKYLYIIAATGSQVLRTTVVGDLKYIPAGNLYAGYSEIVTGTGVASAVSVTNDSNTDGSGTIKFQLIDLTMLGIDTMTKEQAIAWLDAYYPGFHGFNSGTIKNLMATGMKFTGLNQWDEEWEVGTINNTTGQNEPDSTVIRSKNYIPVIGGDTYYFHSPQTFAAYFYDANKSFIAPAVTMAKNSPFELPNGACYMRFRGISAYGTTYHNDICVNISNPARNGEYEPYFEEIIDLPITTMTGKLNGQGESVELFTDGAKGAGTAHDLIRKNDCDVVMAEVDLGNLDWTLYADNMFRASIPGMNSNAGNVNFVCDRYVAALSRGGDKTIARFNPYDTSNYLYITDTSHTTAPTAQDNWLAGVKLVYQLAAPKHYVFDKPLNLMAKTDPDGTQMLLPSQTGMSEPTIAPMLAEIEYYINALKGVAKVVTLTNVLEALKTAGTISAYTMTWNAATGDYDVTITA